MTITKKIVADHWEVNEEDVKCSNCEYWSKNEPNYCIYWDIHENTPDEFCAFWSAKGYTTYIARR